MNKLGAIIKSLIIAFFFSTFFVFLVGTFCGSYINKGLSILNTISIKLNNAGNKEIQFDKMKKRLTHQPAWGANIGRLKIPSISVDLPIYQGDSKAQLVDGAGHHAGSYFPGEGGSILLAAHNSHGLFYTLPQIQINDIVTIEMSYGTYQYQVFKTDIANYNNLEAFPIQDQEEYVMLYTCYPVDNVWYVDDRFIAFAKLVGDPS